MKNNPQAEMMAQQKTVEELEFLLLEGLLEEYLLVKVIFLIFRSQRLSILPNNWRACLKARCY